MSCGLGGRNPVLNLIPGMAGPSLRNVIKKKPWHFFEEEQGILPSVWPILIPEATLSKQVIYHVVVCES